MYRQCTVGQERPYAAPGVEGQPSRYTLAPGGQWCRSESYWPPGGGYDVRGLMTGYAPFPGIPTPKYDAGIMTGIRDFLLDALDHVACKRIVSLLVRGVRSLDEPRWPTRNKLA